jgi:hypothetical protein
MKARGNNSQQSATSARFAPDPLTPEQLNAIDLLIQGKSDQDTADLIGKDRVTIWRWKTRVLRNLLEKALDNVAGAIEAGDVKASFEVIRATGLHTVAPPTGETNVDVISERMMFEILAKEHIPEKSFDMSHLDRNPRYEARKREILEELGRSDLA